MASIKPTIFYWVMDDEQPTLGALYLEKITPHIQVSRDYDSLVSICVYVCVCVCEYQLFF